MFLFILTEKGNFRPGDPAIAGFDVHQYDIGADAADAVPGNHVIIPSPHQAQYPTGTRYHDGSDAALRHFQPHIADISQPLTVIDADHFFTSEL